MLTKEPEMLQPYAFCEYTMQQNSAPPDLLAGFKGAASRREGREKKGRGNEGRGREREERGREGGNWEGRGC